MPRKLNSIVAICKYFVANSESTIYIALVSDPLFLSYCAIKTEDTSFPWSLPC